MAPRDTPDRPVENYTVEQLRKALQDGEVTFDDLADDEAVQVQLQELIDERDGDLEDLLRGL